MAKQEIIMPKIGPYMENGVLISWKVKPGDHVEVMDVIAEVTTEKMNSDIESIYAGTILELTGQVGETYAVGTIIGYLDED